MPIRTPTKRLALVHNGIIENFRELKAELEAGGAKFETATDTEVIAHLITKHLDDGMPPDAAVKAALARLAGAFAIAVLFDGEENLMIGARRGSPLAIGHGDGEMFFGSDAIALAPFTDRITYLDDGDWAVLTRSGATIFDETGAPVERPIVRTVASSLLVDRGNHRHYMAKEIHEQPEVVGHTPRPLSRFRQRAGKASGGLHRRLRGARPPVDRRMRHGLLCGLVAKYWFERLARLPVDIDIASEFRYREQTLPKGGLAIVVSQSGETADTLASLRYAKAQGQRVAAVVNVHTSTIAREADFILPTLAGPEIGVASTKAFTCQLAALIALAIAAGRARGHVSAGEEAEAGPGAIGSAAADEQGAAARGAHRSAGQDARQRQRRPLPGPRHQLSAGAGRRPEAEGNLYIHAEGYAAGELKHGPIALIDKTMPVVVIAPHDQMFDKTASNMQEVAARGGRIVLLTDAKGREAAAIDAIETLILPEMPPTVTPLVYAVPVQLLAYHTAVILGTDVDQPRNLAKSVTVE
jgi:glucosamine--fructose-6-phosphate aminotransferase (isomerizing)